MPTAWIKHCTAYYRDRKKSEPNYTYTKAMRDCRASYTSSIPTPICGKRKLWDCRRRTKCKVTTKSDKRKSFCRLKKNKSRRTTTK